MPQNIQDRSLGELFTELSRGMLTLVRQELAFAKAEVSRKTHRLEQHALWLALGGTFAFAGFLAVLAAVILELARIMPLSMAALLVGLLAAGVGILLLTHGYSRLKEEDLAPRKTLEAFKEDTEWMKEQVR